MPRFFGLALTIMLLAGCGKQYGTVPVHGKVTLNSGAMPGRGAVYFTPVEATGEHPLRPAAAQFGADGVYRVSSFTGAEGLFPGNYRVHVECWETPPTMDGPPPKSYLPTKYTRPNTSGLQLAIPTGSAPQELNVDINDR
jgi:hypothetical protein